MNDVVAPDHTLIKHRSPAMPLIYKELDDNKVKRILDLGSCSPATFNFFRALNCNIHFEMLEVFFNRDSIRTCATKGIIDQLDRYLSDFREGEVFDVILTWDIFNYLDFDGVAWLSKRLEKHCQPNTLLHSVKYLSTKIPTHPRHFKIVDQNDINIIQQTENEPRRHNVSQAMLLQAMPDYLMEHSFLNQPGMASGIAENLLRFMPDQDAQIQTLRDKSFFVPNNGNQEAAKALASATKRSFMANETEKPSSSNSAKEDAPESVPLIKQVSHTSYALQGLFEHLRETEAPRILDLGLHSPKNQDLLKPLSGSYKHDNLYHYLGNQQRFSSISHDPKRSPLSFDQEEKFDVIFFWDILNFLSEKQIENVFARLKRHTHANTLIYTILYSGQLAPTEPQLFDIQKENTIHIFPKSSDRLAPPKITSSQLIKAMKYCALSNAYIYRPGMQNGIFEYLYRPNA